VSGAPIKVLVIEDNPGDARLMREMLSEAKSTRFSVAHAERLSAGLEYLAAEQWDVVVLDLTLPDSSGLDAFTAVHGRVPHVAVIVLTGLDDEELALAAVREGAQDYLVKGRVDSNLLVRAMRYAIERKRIEEERERLIVELQEALDKIKTLSGLLPICMHCKKVRTDENYWQQIEQYVSEHSDTVFTHGLCPECVEKYYGELLNGE